MPMARDDRRLMGRLPRVRGSYTPDAPLKDMTWFRVGGPAEILYRPADLDDLMLFMTYRPREVPVTVIGVGSNLLVRDGGVPGVVIRLGRGFNMISVEGEVLRAGGGVSDINLALTARDAGLGGLEFLRGIPGTVGGAIRMNAGAYGTEVKDVLVRARWIDVTGLLQWSDNAGLGFGYRHCSAPVDRIFVEAVFRGRPEAREVIAQRLERVSAERGASQPVKSSTGGSTFANPPGARAWELIDRAGCRGLVVGDAEVSPKHCNFLINRGNATAADLETLGETVRARVLDATGVDLHWEIRRIGIPAGGAQ